MSAHAILNLLNEFNKFNNTRARMQDSIYHITLKSIFISDCCTKRQYFAIRKRDVFMSVTKRNVTK